MVISGLLLPLMGFCQESEGMAAREERVKEEPVPGWDELEAQCKVLRNKRDSSVLAISRQAIARAQKENSPAHLQDAMLLHAENLIEMNHYTEAINWLNQMGELSEKGISREREGRSMKLYGVAHNMQANYKLAGFYLEKSKALFESIHDAAQIADVEELLATNHRYRGNYQESAEYRYQALEYYESVGDSDNIVKCKDGIGIINFLEGENEKALEDFSHGLAYYERKKDSFSLGFSYTLMGLATSGMEAYEKSLEFNLKSLLIRQKIKDIRGEGESYNNLALVYMGTGQWDQAAEYLVKAREKLLEGNDLRQIPIITGNLAHARLMQGDKDEAVKLYTEAIESATESGMQFTLNRLYKRFTQIYVDEGDYETAYDYLTKYIMLKDSLFDLEKVKAIDELRIEYDTEKKEQEIGMLRKKQELQEREARLDRRKWLAMGGGLGLIIIILFLTISRQRLKIQKDAQLHAQEKTILQTREALTASELRNTRLSLQHQQQQLKAFTESIHQKNKMLDELEGKLQSLETENQQAEDERNSKLNELMEMRILTDEDWDEFRDLFEQVHSGLTHSLRDQFPSLTVGETRLFMLLKLKFNSREIARVLGVSPDSVKKGRYRLRKKLDLPEGQDLQEFAINFDPQHHA